jgi:DNA-binding NarL/FixJ family response regulator
VAAAATILIVEDELIVALDLSQAVEDLGHEVAGTASTSEEAVALAQATRPDLVLMDIRLAGGVDGIDTAAVIQRAHPCPVVFVTAYDDDATLARGRVVEPCGYLVKPVDTQDLREVIQAALESTAETRAVTGDH